jgi:predicted HicB family RNase H-like nuclease
MDEQTLREEIYDAIAAGRNSLRVAYEQPKPETGATFSVKFVLTVDEKVRQALHAEHVRQDVSMPRLVRRYVRECFYECISDEKIAEPELKAA